MNLKELLDKGRIDKVESSEMNFDKVESDLIVAKTNFDNGSYEWALSICYHEILRLGMDFMSFLGYRAKGREHHRNVFLFLSAYDEVRSLAKYFDRIRRKRNEFIYRGSDEISKDEAFETLNIAKGFVSKIRTIVSKIRTEVKDE